MNENILISYQNSSSSTSSSSSSSSSLKITGLNNKKNINENIANSITQLNKILNTQQALSQNNTSNDFFYKNYYTRDTNEIQIVNDNDRNKNNKSSSKSSATLNGLSSQESNFIITPPTPLTRNTSYIVNEKIKQFNAVNHNSNQNRFFSLSNNRTEDSMLPIATSFVSNGYENSTSNNSLSLSVLSNTSSQVISNTHATSTSSPSNEMDDEISFLKTEGVVKTLRKKFLEANNHSVRNNISHDENEDRSFHSYRSDNNNNNFSFNYKNVNNRKNTNNNIFKREEFKEFKFQNLKNLSTSSLDVSNDLNTKLKKCQSVRFEASIEPDEFLLENQESATYETLSEKIQTTPNKLNQKSKSINFLNDYTQMDRKNFHKSLVKADSPKLEILSENSKQDESSVFENVDIKEKINKFASINNELTVSISLNKNSAKQFKHTHTSSNASSIISGGEDEADNYSCIVSSRVSPNKTNDTHRSKTPPVPTKRTICVTSNKDLIYIKNDNNNSMASNDDTSNDSANSTFSEENGNLILVENQSNIVLDVVDLKKNLSPISSSSLSLSSSISLSSRGDLLNSKCNFDSVKFEENYVKIKNAFMDLKTDNELIQTLLNEIRNKVQDTLVQINMETTIDDNNNSNNEDEENLIEGLNYIQDDKGNEMENFTDSNEYYKISFDPSTNRSLKGSNESTKLIRHKF